MFIINRLLFKLLAYASVSPLGGSPLN